MSDADESEEPVESAPGEEASEGGEDVAAWRDKYLRTLAELDNYRKRSDREREAARRYALDGFMRDLLPCSTASRRRWG
ncbi:MAG: nucleotide exchange factor GrpE, partial [Planctomycetes bacterium]|nr:nucleotide exchange factor GrpE [Planctomycetota bacterium]